MNIHKIFASFSLLLFADVFAFAQRTVIIYDPEKPVQPMKISAAEKRLIERNVLPKARQTWKKNESCAEDFRIVDAAQGSFTRKGATQKAFLYEFCQTGNGWANNGLVITENGKIVAHFIEEGGWNMSLSKLPDINRNGFDELVVETSGGMHQGKYGGSVTLLEVSPVRVNEFGYTLAFSNECDNEDSAADCDKSFKITAVPAAKPVFYKEKFINIGDDESPRWKRGGRPQKFALDKSENSYRLLK